MGATTPTAPQLCEFDSQQMIQSHIKTLYVLLRYLLEKFLGVEGSRNTRDGPHFK